MKDVVKSYFISHPLTELILDIFSLLQFKEESNCKGILIQGGYGAGKSHLIAFLSSIAEDENLVKYITNPIVQEESAKIAGTFKVIKSAFYPKGMGLRDIVVTELEKGLAKMGVVFKFPSADQITNNKDSITAMMGEFGDKYPDKGLLFALDELLDYLRTRKEQELVQDLIFLRELGEVCKETRFRFIADVQEAKSDTLSLRNINNNLRRFSIPTVSEILPCLVAEMCGLSLDSTFYTRARNLISWIKSHMNEWLTSPRAQVFKSDPQDLKIERLDEETEKVHVLFLKSKNQPIAIQFWMFDRAIKHLQDNFPNPVPLGAKFQPPYIPNSVEEAIWTKPYPTGKSTYKVSTHVCDILALAGLAEYTKARNPQTGRQVQGARMKPRARG